jgi:RND family efflux transporter MFP subunit
VSASTPELGSAEAVVAGAAGARAKAGAAPFGDPTALATRGRRWFHASGVFLLLLAGLGLVLLAGARRGRESRQRAERRAASARGPRTLLATAVAGPGERHLVLQGEARPYRSVVVYSKVSGYLRVLRVDRGDRVKEGDVLAVVGSPELDRQLQAAEADAAFKRASARRTKNLGSPGLVAARDVEQDESAAQVAEAQAASLAAQRGYTVIKAPFSGLVTGRFAERGALVQSAANAQSGALPIVTVSQVDRLRVFAYADQQDAPFVARGTRATIAAAEGIGSVEARVSRVSGELEPRTRTMLVEIEVPNQDGRLLAGSFVSVTLTLKAPPSVEIPAEGLLVRDQKPFVGVMTDDGRVHFRAVGIGSHDGQRVRLRSGVREGERIALNLGRGASDGDLLEPVLLDAPATQRSARARERE